ncbi:MAG: pirin family protein [Candidatus Sericytochromatia bacterium]|nr:pirin family protein [Candidatus Sericytochromatia bacterium]
MIHIRKSEERGHANHGWLDSYHTFSFADYHDPEFMGFRHLRVINQDWIDKGMGFGTHPHNNMEIITYITEGALEHKDSMGTGSVIYPGDVQRMSAGTGVTHSEFNHSKTEAARLLQIWILPEENNIKPSYEQKNYSQEEKSGKLRVIASKNGDNGSVKINQNVSLYASILDKDQEVNHKFDKNRHGWIQIVKGSVLLNNEYELAEGDGVAISEEEQLTLKGNNKSEILLFDLA